MIQWLLILVFLYSLEITACKEFKIALGTVLKCYTDAITGSQTCTMECEAGKVLPPGLTDLQSYTCGPSTNYEWDNFENPPGCIGKLLVLKVITQNKQKNINKEIYFLSLFYYVYR